MPDPVLRAASTLGTVLLAPVLVYQGRRVRATTPRLPEAPGPRAGEIAGTGPALHLLVLGESPAAGVGAEDHHEALAGQVARALAARTGRRVRWRVLARNGATAASAREELLMPADALAADVAVVALGVNDTLRLHSPGRWTRDLHRLIGLLRERCGAVPVVLASVPPMGVFPALPRPLRSVLGLRAAVLDRAAARLAGEMDAVRHVPVPLPPGAVDAFFCADRFHPSPYGYALWGEALGRAAAAALG
ncbi:MAG TPA: SGNH/GDSL hydrolase family protein [Longimicrobium sp.]|nr:SGNH/GDSL hydrolase family protein [Longimicrobium sp.]